MVKVSVIVPVYNAEKYLEKCLKSIVNQSLEEIEILVVNDGSKDTSRAIIEKYVEQYPQKVKLLNKENGGLSETRNLGIEYATGEYLAFVDSDDYIERNMLEMMYGKAKAGNFDVVCCDVMAIYPDKNVKIKSGIREDKTGMSLEDKKQILLNAYPIVCNKIYKREVFNHKNQFKKGVWFEDVLFEFQTVPFLTSIGVIPECLYNYLQNPTSITYTYNKKLYDMIDNFDEIINFYKNNNLYESYQDILEYSYARYVLATFVKRLAKAKNKKVFKEGTEHAIKKVKEKFPNYKKNLYLKNFSGKSFYIKHFNKCFAKIVYQMEKNKMN